MFSKMIVTCSMRKIKRLTDCYKVPGFIPRHKVVGVFGDPKARVIKLYRIEKKRVVRNAAGSIADFMTARSAVSVIFHVATHGSILSWKSAAFTAGSAGK